MNRHRSSFLSILQAVPLALLVLVVPGCDAIHIHVDGGYEERVGNDLRQLQTIIEGFKQAPKGCRDCARDDPSLHWRFKMLSQQYLFDESASEPEWTREDVAARWNIPLEKLDGMAQHVGLCRRKECPESAHVPEPALPLDQLNIPWQGVSVPFEAIAWREMIKAGLKIIVPGERLNDLPIAMAHVPGYMARHLAVQEWKAILQAIDFDPANLTNADRIFLLAGLGRRDMQILGKAIVFPSLLTPVERWEAQGYPTLPVAIQNIRHSLKYDNNGAVGIEETLNRLAYHPSTITDNDCALLENRFHLELENRAQPEMVAPEQRNLFQNALLNTMEYFDLDHAVNWSPSSAKIETLDKSRQATRTKEEFLAKFNCIYRVSLRHSRYQDLVRGGRKRDLLNKLQGHLVGEKEEFRSLYEGFFLSTLKNYG